MSESKRRKISDLWNFFTPSDNEYAICNICRQKLSYKTSTSNLKKHMSSKHPFVAIPTHSSATDSVCEVIEYNMRVECKCHGVSGSCETKTCWRALPKFRLVGSVLKEKFDGATEVQARRMGKRSQLVPMNVYFKHHSDVDLVYLDSSPDFCERDSRAGTLGTHGRRCNRTSSDIDGCELLCCGRGYTSRTERVKERCDCKFYWCCYVKCKECERDIEMNTCL